VEAIMVHMEICGNNIMIWYNHVKTIYGPRPRSGRVVYLRNDSIFKGKMVITQFMQWGTICIFRLGLMYQHFNRG
jgi:hypothetical protein